MAGRVGLFAVTVAKRVRWYLPIDWHADVGLTVAGLITLTISVFVAALDGTVFHESRRKLTE
jgi:hypothetical protein